MAIFHISNGWFKCVQASVHWFNVSFQHIKLLKTKKERKKENEVNILFEIWGLRSPEIYFYLLGILGYVEEQIDSNISNDLLPPSSG